MERKLKFSCHEHGQQESVKVGFVHLFGGYFRIELGCGCTFDCFPGNEFKYVGQLKDGWTSVPYGNGYW